MSQGFTERPPMQLFPGRLDGAKSAAQLPAKAVIRRKNP
jgi:hypothetical protein